MTALLKPRRAFGTLLALLLGYGLWRASDAVVDLLQWPDLLPVVRLLALALGVTGLDLLFTALRPWLREPHAQTPDQGERE